MSTRRWGEDREDSDGKRAKEDGKLSKALMERPTVANYVTHEEKTIETQDREGKVEDTHHHTTHTPRCARLSRTLYPASTYTNPPLVYVW